MRYKLIILALLSTYILHAQPSDSLLDQLDTEISRRPAYTAEKIKRIDSLKALLPRTNKTDEYDLVLRIYDEYKTFVYDSAFLYARRLQRLADDLKQPAKVGHGKIKIGFALLSAGMFSEALDTLRSVRTKLLPDSLRTEYFYLMARTCYDMADFNRDNFYRKIYTHLAQNYIDSALRILPERSVNYLLMSGLRDLHLRNMGPAQKNYEDLLTNFSLTDQQFAIAASTLSFVYLYSDKVEKAKEMLIRAAITDIRSNTKETVAMLNLADMFYKEGEIERAYRYIKVAMEDADFYGARQRRAQVAAIFPVIEGRQLSETESKRQSLLVYSLLITAFTLSAVAFSFIIFKQNKKLHEARKIISQANDSLAEANRHLQDANKIKEEYIWYYFNATAEYISKLDALKKSLDLKLKTKKPEELKFIVDNINIRHERDELYHHFDKVFLNLFPEFVTRFNALFPDEEKIVLKDGQLLNTELRIFALVRMGIHDHERIAKILDYSVTTIYTYKTRLRSKALVSGDEFQKRIMEIPAI